MLWDPNISGFSDTFLNFLRQFLPEFKAFLDREGILDKSYFHLSDEPGDGQHIANYKRARQILRDLAPWMKVMDALSDIEYGKQGLTDMPIPHGQFRPGLHRREDPALGLLLLRPARSVAQPVPRHAAAEGAHVRDALLPARRQGIPPLGLQLLAQDGAGGRSAIRSTTRRTPSIPASRTATRS